MSVKRWYSPAYKTHDGRVTRIGAETCWLPGALRDVRALNEDDPSTEFFVAYQDVPDWERLSDDDRIADLTEASSLGTVGATALRESVSEAQAEEIVRRANEFRSTP